MGAEAFAAALADHDGRLHRAPSLAGALEHARALIGEATVTRFADSALDGIAQAEAGAAEAEVSLVLADVAIAETGQIGWIHGAGRPRATGLLPERQIALLSADDLVVSVAEALSRFYASGAAPPGNLVLVAGPSRTSDIEQRSIRGVHAPRELDVILYEGPGPGRP